MPQTKVQQFLPVLSRRILTAPIGMHNAIRIEPAVAHGHVHRVGDQFGAHVVSHRVADHLARGTVDQRRQIQPALPGPDIGDVADNLGARPRRR